jgi:peptidoglycan/xylan/chitin deacetylase (PgdA/CDA1 family)
MNAGSPSSRALALTFDDGPHPEGTPAVLDALRECHASATFFMIGPLAERHPELVAQVGADGHTIGLHCDEHVRHSDRDRDWLAADTERALQRLARLDVIPTLWRTPWGDRAPWTAEIAAEHGLSLVDWDLDTHDWRGDNAGTMFGATRAKLAPGAIVLAHDGIGPGARRDDTDATAAWVAMVGRHAAEQGLELERLA